MQVTRGDAVAQGAGVRRALAAASFVAFDAEFTGIPSHDAFRYRLFDTNEERYDKIKSCVSKMIMTQVGLTMFQYDRERNTYVASSYTFHLCPQVFGDIDQSFVFQASTLQFLCRHQFDFNKFTYEGIPYLSRAEEEAVRRQLRENKLFNNLTRSLEMEDEKTLQQQCSTVSRWLTQQEGYMLYVDVSTPIMRYILHKELRNRFPDVLTTNSLGESNKLLVYRNKDIEGATSLTDQQLDDALMTHLIGFSEIIKTLAQLKKPIVGHNIYLDLILLHNQFIGPLPNKYSQFKRNIHEFWPKIYDTKHISMIMGRNLTFDEVWKSNALQDLYEFFHENKCKKLVGVGSLVHLQTPFNNKQTYHEAGWDSYCTGYIFTRLGQWSAILTGGRRSGAGAIEIIAALEPYVNKINVIRGALPYLHLSADDPPCHRPGLVYVQTLDRRPIDIGHVAALLAGYGSIDVKPYGARAALVAANSQATTEKILKRFNSSDYRVSLYSVYRHSRAAAFALWSGALVTGSLVLLLIHRRIQS